MLHWCCLCQRMLWLEVVLVANESVLIDPFSMTMRAPEFLSRLS